MNKEVKITPKVRWCQSYRWIWGTGWEVQIKTPSRYLVDRVFAVCHHCVKFGV